MSSEQQRQIDYLNEQVSKLTGVVSELLDAVDRLNDAAAIDEITQSDVRAHLGHAWRQVPTA